ncbi:TPA: hypothetical protein QCX47_005438 [Bacillus mycoides]|uniref:hypothetical protein n=1 Tax=Bacillus TaxID=1386 RepID=UPI000B1DBCC8|nr:MULTISPECIES: hypothetical protein [Bacillus cereus group]HDR7613649.1 hypothetical protein [Bacillus mycoides]
MAVKHIVGNEDIIHSDFVFEALCHLDIGTAIVSFMPMIFPVLYLSIVKSHMISMPIFYLLAF